jgi:hypothetical protein
MAPSLQSAPDKGALDAFSHRMATVQDVEPFGPVNRGDRGDSDRTSLRSHRDIET